MSTAQDLHSLDDTFIPIQKLVRNFRSELKKRNIHLGTTAVSNFRYFCYEILLFETIQSVFMFLDHVRFYLSAAYEMRSTVPEYDIFFTTDNILYCGSQTINMSYQYFVSFLGSTILKINLQTKYNVPVIQLEATPTTTDIH
jgi:hypothetical protein